MSQKVLTVITLMVLACVTLLVAQVPRIMNYQGKITDDGGVALHGTFTIDFGIYNGSTGGSALWSETRTVNIENGLFDIQLGTITPIFLDFSEPYWLELKISTDGGSTWETFDPREKLATVSYAFRAIYSDTSSYSDTAFYSLYALFTPPTALILPDPAEVCAGEDLLLNGNPSGGSGTFAAHSWTGDTGPLSATDVQNPTFNSSSAGTYNLTYTVTDDRGATGSDAITVTVNPNPVTPSPTAGPATICPGESSTLYANTIADEYSWREGSCTGVIISTATNPVVNPSATTTYFLKVAVDDCWSDCGEVTVTVNTLSIAPTGAEATPNPICSGESTTLNVVGGSLGTGASWEWYSGSCGGTHVGSGSPSVSPTSTTTYYVRAEGTCNTTPCASVTVTVDPLPGITAHPSNQTTGEGENASFSITASDVNSYQWQENDGGGWSDISDGGSNPTYSGATTATLTLTNVPISFNGYDYRCILTNDCGSVNSDPADLTVNVWMICGENTVIDVTNSSTGDTWMDRNLGASQQATAFNDHNAYGALFQWGRLSDGHECITWTGSNSGTPVNGTTTTLSSTDNPGHSLFIVNPSSPEDWRSPQNDNLWQGASGINNPCPSGYRLPTSTELDNERLSWSSNDCYGAFASPLKLAVAGYHDYISGVIYNTGVRGYCWSSTLSGIRALRLIFLSGTANMSTYERANGYCVRCIKDCHVPAIEAHPSSNTIENGDNTSFSVTATGAISYQWQENTGSGWSDISDGGSNPAYSGATTATLSLTNVPLSYDGYEYRCVVTNSCGSINTNSALLTVSLPGCGTLTDIDGNTYNTILIGSQCWMKENLNTTRDAAGNSINRYCYGDNPTNCDTYGGLYTWASMMNGSAGSSTIPSGVQGICPDGWHLPSDGEWCELENHIEPGTDPSCNSIGWLGTYVGGALKETGTTHWNSPNTGATNSSGFTALPGGWRDTGGSYNWLRQFGIFWSTSEYDSWQKYPRLLYFELATIYRDYYNRDYAYSVRCVKDPPTIESPCGETIILDVTSPATGKTWMDRNLGASRQATAYNDYEAYGSLFQWGRLSDGHECINWTGPSSGSPVNGTTNTPSSTDDPGHNLFYYSEGVYPEDWRVPQNNALWQGVSGTNNPCPSGYRLPTETEFQNEIVSWSSNDYYGAFGSPLKIVTAGYRSGYSGGLSLSSAGYYWTSTVSGIQARHLGCSGGDASIRTDHRDLGYCVRCIKD